jgi:hypothetical protein
MLQCFFIYLFLGPFMFYEGFPTLLNYTRIGLLLWCLCCLFNFRIKYRLKTIKIILSVIWLLVMFVGWYIIIMPRDIQIYSTKITFYWLIASWLWVLFYILYLWKRWVILLVLTIISAIPSFVYWRSMPTGQHISYERHDSRIRQTHCCPK